MLLDTERLAAGWWRAALGATLLSGACAGTDERLLPGSPWLGASVPSTTDAALPAEQDGGADSGDPTPPPADASTDSAPAALTAMVTVDLTAPRRTVPPHAFGLHASVYDNGLHDPAVPALLDQAGVTLLRWPGGGYADNYPWSTHSLTPWYGDPSKPGYLAADTEATRYDYLPVGNANGTISGPTPFGGAGNQFTVELASYAVTDLVLRRKISGYATLPWDASPRARATP